MNHKLSEKWIKASIAGTIWAASEIVLGSFLHNLAIPFSGNILTAIGIVILISINYVWNERGLFWRAGLICALMKTMSPSAVIFGPMLAIFAEGLLLELSVRLMGRTIPGYLTGAMLAMSWNLFQKIGSYILYYGSNIIEVYSNLLKMAQKQLNITTDIVWLPIIILLVVYAAFGFFAGLIGIRVGRKMLRQPVSDITFIETEPLKQAFHIKGSDFNYSVSWLIINIILIIGSFFLLSLTSWHVWSIAITAIIVLWASRYRRALRQLKKPKFWIFFVAITIITAFVFTKAKPGDSFWETGLLTGIQMNFRAVVIIVGFSTLGTELYNPVVRNFFMGTRFKNLPLALELSAESLPSFIASIPEFKSVVKNPVSVFYRVLSQADIRLSEIREKNNAGRKIYIISGSRDEGKTSYSEKLVSFLKENNSNPSGIIAKKIYKGSELSGYDLMDIASGESKRFLRIDEKCGTEKIGKYTICPEGLAFGEKILNESALKNNLVLVDEVGQLELVGRGWSVNIEKLISADARVIFVVRDEFVKRVMDKWNLSDAAVFKISDIDFRDAGKTIMRS